MIYYFLANSENNITSLELILPNGENCAHDPREKYHTSFEIVCSEKAKIPILDKTLRFNGTSCYNKIKLFSKEACPDFSFYGFFNKIISNRYIFAPLLIIFGIFLCFFGYGFYDVLCIITGVLIVSFVVLFLIFSNINIEYSSWGFWILIIFVILLGVVVGFLIKKYNLKIIIDIALAGFAGYMLGVFLYNFFLNQISVNPKIVYFSSIVFSIILLEFLICMFRRFMIIWCTAFIGAYATIRGFSFAFGGFPSENMIIDLIENKEWGQLKEVNHIKFFYYFYFS